MICPCWKTRLSIFSTVSKHALGYVRSSTFKWTSTRPTHHPCPHYSHLETCCFQQIKIGLWLLKSTALLCGNETKTQKKISEQRINSSIVLQINNRGAEKKLTVGEFYGNARSKATSLKNEHWHHKCALISLCAKKLAKSGFRWLPHVHLLRLLNWTHITYPLISPETKKIKLIKRS